MITTATAAFVLEQDAQVKFDGSSISAVPTFFPLLAKASVLLIVQDSVSTNEIGRATMELTTTEIDAETGAGAAETAIWYNAVERAVKTKLEAIADNASVTFAIV
jgi:hypothetical protein